MYIRSQNRHNLFSFHDMNIYIDGGTRIFYSNGDCYTRIGIYKTPKRCLEVFNDIQYTIQYCYGREVLESSELLNYERGVYTMPLE